MVNLAKYGAAIKSIWLDTCTVSIKQNTVTSTGRTVQTDTVLFENEPCRLSFSSVTVPEETSHAAKRVQSTVLLIDKAKEIPAGSIITVTHEGVTSTYARSGVPSVYSFHQQIPLELKEEWA